MIAIDFGLKRVGVAWKCGELILPLPAIQFNTPAQVASELRDILGEKKARILIVGKVREDLQGALDEVLNALDFGGEIAFVDENLSSKEAELHINGRKKSKRKSRGRKSLKGR